MAAINDLIAQIEDEALRERIEKEVDKLAKQKKFGLVFEEHLPECTPLYDVPVRRGSKVSLRAGKTSETFTVLSVKDGKAACLPKNGNEAIEYAVDELVSTAEFGDPIYPFLQPLDSVCNAPDSDLWHTLIEADNYHALQLLEYLYAGKVDCIYIDPPYNKEDSNDWKYNCNYVDSTDAYRHSKWLSMMQKRLKIAKKLLNPNDSVLVVTIDETEYLHLGCLLEELFPEAQMQMISITINASGAVRKGMFSRSDEYAYFLFFGNAHIVLPAGDGKQSEVRWWYLRRLEDRSTRQNIPNTNQFYPIYINDKCEIVHIGEPVKAGINIHDVPDYPDSTKVFPIRDDGEEMTWGLTIPTLKRLMSEHMIQVLPNKNSEYQPFTIKYLSENYKDKIESGRWMIIGQREDGSNIVIESNGKVTRPTTVWKNPEYEAKKYGTTVLKDIVGKERFSYPKSLYAVHDCLARCGCVTEKKNALIIDFFAGSGTTLHAVNLLNAEDGGQRRCILVTNNEMKKDEEDSLLRKGVERCSDEWNALGIARYVTWPRTVCSIEGHDVNGNPLKGNYLGSDLPMADGFKANAAFFKLGFLDKTKVSLGRQFKEMIPTLWMKAGAHGPCPCIEENAPDMLILPENRMAILNDENLFNIFADKIAEHPEIETVYIVTDYEAGFATMAQALPGKKTVQLYRDYLDNFRINAGRNNR